jgi:transcriptional regulator with XRE-family HTH domain
MPPTTTTDTRDELRRRGRFIDGATFGAFLRNHREGRNLSLQDIAAGTKIATRHLAALERGDVRSWPGGIYRRAMVRAYAAAVGLDPDVTFNEFTDAFAEAPAAVEPDVKPASPVPVHALAAIRPGAPVYLGLAGCAALALLGWTVTSSDAAGAMKTWADGPALSSVEGPAPSSVEGPAPSSVEGPNQSYEPAAEAVVNASASQSLSAEPAVQNASTVESAESIEGSLRIASEPAGADVTVNGIRWGHTPVTIRYLAPGEKRVRLSMQGYTSVERRLELTTEQPAQAVRVVLNAAPQD